jgi:hypothetical protein
MSLLMHGYPAHLSDINGGEESTHTASAPSTASQPETSRSSIFTRPLQFDSNSFGVVGKNGLEIAIGIIYAIFAFKLADQCFSDQIKPSPSPGIVDEASTESHNFHIWFAFFLGFVGVCVSMGLFKWNIVYRSCAIGVFYGGLATMAVALYCLFDSLDSWGHIAMIIIVIIALILLPLATNKLVNTSS